jgi:hypothetical protein
LCITPPPIQVDSGSKNSERKKTIKVEKKIEVNNLLSKIIFLKKTFMKKRGKRYTDIIELFPKRKYFNERTEICCSVINAGKR